MKTMTIEAFLTWAFTAELCKVGGGGDGLTAVSVSNWSFTKDLLTLGTLIDRSPNHYGVIPGFIEDGEPHPDALVVGDAVRALAARGFDIPEGWQPFPEWSDEHGLIAAEVARVVGEVRLKGERLAGRHVVALVTSAAILGRGPDWEVKEPTTRMVEANGKPLWFRTDANLSYVITSSGGDISLKYFKARETRAGVTAAPRGQRQLFAGTFMKGGRFPNRVTAKGLNGHVYRRTGKGRGPLELQDSGVIIPAEMISGASASAFTDIVEAELPKRVMHEIEYLAPGIFD